MKFDAVAFGKSIGELLKAEVAPLREEIAKLKAENAALRESQEALAKQIAAATMKGSVIDRDGCLIHTLGDGSTHKVGIVVGKDADESAIKAHLAAEVLKALPQPKPGDRLTPEDFRHMVADLVVSEVKTAIAALPTPKDGKDVDAAALQAAIETAVQKAVAAMPKPQEAKAFEPESVRHILAELVDGAVKALPAPKDGKDVDAAALQAAIETAVQKRFDALPKPQEVKGFEPEAVRHILAELVDGAVKALPVPKDGKDVDAVALQASIDAAVQKAVAAMPKPQEAKAFEPESVRHILAELVDGAIAKGLDTIRLPDPEPGIADSTINDKGYLVLTRTDGKILVPGRVQGKDAFRLEDLQLAIEDGGRHLVVGFKSGEQLVERKVKTALVIDRGVWKQGPYDAGDAVTLKGSWWVAERDTEGRPGDENSGWRLTVKRGRDGRAPGRGGSS